MVWAPLSAKTRWKKVAGVAAVNRPAEARRVVFRVGIEGQGDAGLPLREVVGECAAGRARLPGSGAWGLNWAAQRRPAVRKRLGPELGAQVGVQRELLDGGGVAGVAGGEGLLEAAGIAGEVVGQGVVVETAVEVVLLLLVRGRVGVAAAEGEGAGAAGGGQVVGELELARGVEVLALRVAAERAEAVDVLLGRARELGGAVAVVDGEGKDSRVEGAVR